MLSFNEQDMEEICPKNSRPNVNASQEDLVDVISNAAKRLIEDPNSYYNNLKHSKEPRKFYSPSNDEVSEESHQFNFNDNKYQDTPELGKGKAELKDEEVL